MSALLCLNDALPGVQAATQSIVAVNWLKVYYIPFNQSALTTVWVDVLHTVEVFILQMIRYPVAMYDEV